ncbi:MAG: DUF115 domain-containing protein [bacterium]|nr:DUF115 domain-containing protein [bacterium]
MAHLEVKNSVRNIVRISGNRQGDSNEIRDNYYLDNISSLRQYNPVLAAKIDSVNPGEDDPEFPGWKFEVRDARNGQKTMFCVGDGTEIAIHSTYDPDREASDQVNGILDEKRNYFVILGLGLGYAVEKLIDEVGLETRILVIEPHISAVRLAMSTRDMRKILNDKRIHITIGINIENVLGNFLSRYNLAEVNGVGFMELAGRKKLPSAKFYSDLLTRLKGVVITTGGNLQTLMLMAWTYQKNTMESIGNIADHPPVRLLFNAFEEKPAIIVSAGPSLEKNIDLVRQYRDRAVIIGVDTSTRPILKAGFEPDLICTGDPQEANWKHLRGTNTVNSILVAEPMTHPLSLEFFKNRLFIASYNDKVMKWISQFIPDVGHIMTWGSVATMAFDLARKMGCDPIIFVGQDLSFSGGRTYVKGTYFEDEEKQDMSVQAFEKKNRAMVMTDIYGNEVKTNRQMFAYKEWFLTEFGRTQARIINATEGGILDGNCEIKTFKEAAEEYLKEPFDALSIIREKGKQFEGYNLDPLRAGLFNNIRSIKNCIDLCEKGLSRVRQAALTLEKIDKLSAKFAQEVIKELDEYRFELMEEPSMKEFIETANQVGVLNFKRAFKAVNGRDFSRMTFREALDLYTNLFMSTGKTCRGVLPFFVMGFRKLADRSDAGTVNVEDLCQTKI